MALANVYIDYIGSVNATDLLVRFYATNSAGKVQPQDELTVSSTGRGLAQVARQLRAQVIAWAATVAGGSLTLTPADVWICGLADDQIIGVRKSVDASTSSGSFVDVPEMVLPVAANSHYKFRFKGAYTTAINTTGVQLSVNGPASPTFLRAVGTIYTTTIAPFVGVLTAYDSPIAATASSGATALPFELEGTISTGAAGGVLQLRGRSEVAGSAVTILRGSFGELIAVS